MKTKTKYTAQLTVNGETLLELITKGTAAAEQFVAGMDAVVDLDLVSTRSLAEGTWTATAMITVAPVIYPDTIEQTLARVNAEKDKA